MASVAQEAAAIPRVKRRWEGLPYWLVLPTLGYLAVFFAWPMLKSFQLAFQDVGGNWSFDSIERMYHDAEFKRALTFTRIVINKEDINSVINDEAQKLQDVLNAAAAPCWKPDAPSTGTCQVGAANP